MWLRTTKGVEYGPYVQCPLINTGSKCRSVSNKVQIDPQVAAVVVVALCGNPIPNPACGCSVCI